MLRPQKSGGRGADPPLELLPNRLDDFLGAETVCLGREELVEVRLLVEPVAATGVVEKQQLVAKIGERRRQKVPGRRSGPMRPPISSLSSTPRWSSDWPPNEYMRVADATRVPIR